MPYVIGLVYPGDRPWSIPEGDSSPLWTSGNGIAGKVGAARPPSSPRLSLLLPRDGGGRYRVLGLRGRSNDLADELV